MKKFISEFKEFISKGDVMSMAVGIIIGGAELMVGNFIQAIIVFLLTALVIFWMMKVFNRVFAKKKAEPEVPAEPEPAPVPEDVQLLREIRDLLQAGR